MEGNPYSLSSPLMDRNPSSAWGVNGAVVQWRTKTKWNKVRGRERWLPHPLQQLTSYLFWVSNPVFLSHHLQSCKLLCVSTGVTVTSSQWSIKRKLDLFWGPKTRQNDKGFWALPEQPAQLRQVRLCCRNTQHQHPSNLTQQKFIYCSYKVHYRSGRPSRTDTSPQCGRSAFQTVLISWLLYAYMTEAEDSTRVLYQQISASVQKWDFYTTHCSKLSQDPVERKGAKKDNHYPTTFFFFFWLSHISLQDTSSPTKDWTQTLSSESEESYWTARKSQPPHSYCSLGYKLHSNKHFVSLSIIMSLA